MRVRPPCFVSPFRRGQPSWTGALIIAAIMAASAALAPAQQQFVQLAQGGSGMTFNASAVAMGDVDVDGDLDLILALGYFGRAQNRLYLNDGTGTFTDATAQQMPALVDNTAAVALGDVDADGDLDIVFGNADLVGAQNRLYLNDGTGTYTDATAQRLPAYLDDTMSVALGDVDGDNDLDIIFGNDNQITGGTSRLYLNDGTGTFTGGWLPSNSLRVAAVALGDADGDGDLDVVVGSRFWRWSQPGGGQNELLLNNGNGAYRSVTSSRMPRRLDDTTSVALGDVDGDGDLDIVFGNGFLSAARNRLYLNDGTGNFDDATTQRLLPTLSATTWSLAMADVDDDGDLDIVFGDGRALLYLNDGTGTFTRQMSRIPVSARSAETFGDVDGDGDPDLVTGTGTIEAQVFRNLHRQLTTPSAPIRSRPYEIVLHAEPGYASSAHTAATALGFGLSPVPLRVPGLGTFFLNPTPLWPLPPVTIPQPGGGVATQLQVPASPSLAGLVIYLQGMIVNNATGQARFTGYTADEIR